MSDYEQFLIENGLTEEAMQNGLIVSEVDWSPQYGVIVLPSDIQGKGIFSQHSFVRDETIGAIFRNGKWTMLGRFTNHSATPNAKVVRSEDGSFALVSIAHIPICREITANYRQVMIVMQPQNETVLT